MIVVKVNWSAGNIKINGNDGQPRRNFCIITLGPPEVTNKYAPLFCNIISSDWKRYFFMLQMLLTFYYISHFIVLLCLKFSYFIYLLDNPYNQTVQYSL